MNVLFLGDLCTNEYDSTTLESFTRSDIYEYLNSEGKLVVGNLEAPLLEKPIIKNKNKASFINKLEFLKFYDFVDVYNLANNHIMDQGIAGLSQTINNLEGLNKQYLGAGSNLNEARKPVIVECDGYKICLLSYCCYSANSESYAKNSSEGPNPLVFEYMTEDISKAKKLADFVLVLPHWGVEHEFHPTYDQVIFARKAIDIGADAIIGCHSHTLQSFEVYKNKPIYYSIGNFFMKDFFLSDLDKYYWTDFNKEGMLIELRVERRELIFKELYFRYDEFFIPQFCNKKELLTKVDENNNYLLAKAIKIKHTSYLPNLSLSLAFNGKSMQVINDSPIIGASFKGSKELFKAKVKRILMVLVRKLFKLNR